MTSPLSNLSAVKLTNSYHTLLQIFWWVLLLWGSHPAYITLFTFKCLEYQHNSGNGMATTKKTSSYQHTTFECREEILFISHPRISSWHSTSWNEFFDVSKINVTSQVEVTCSPKHSTEMSLLGLPSSLVLFLILRHIPHVGIQSDSRKT